MTAVVNVLVVVEVVEAVVIVDVVVGDVGSPSSMLPNPRNRSPAGIDPRSAAYEVEASPLSYATDFFKYL